MILLTVQLFIVQMQFLTRVLFLIYVTKQSVALCDDPQKVIPGCLADMGGAVKLFVCQGRDLQGMF